MDIPTGWGMLVAFVGDIGEDAAKCSITALIMACSWL
jgi:hypothetical protein